MKAVGIVAEYNPFHNGHLHHLQETKRLTSLPVMAVMSGSFMQRGEPTFIDKWTRARLAVENGVDLVVELPAAFSLRSAEFFARGAVELMQATGCVSRLSCGVESVGVDFTHLAAITQGEGFTALLQSNLDAGLPYAAAYEAALQRLAGTAKLNTPNDILALEYCKALQKTDITPIFIERQQASYNDDKITGSIASATAIRKACLENNWHAVQGAVPPNVWDALQKGTAPDEGLLWHLIAYRLRLLAPSQIEKQCQCTEGLENLLKQAANCTSLNEALTLCSSKRYPIARIRRLFMQLLLGKERCYLEQEHPAYLRVLAFNDIGRHLLKQMKGSCSLPILTKLGKYPSNGQTTAFARQLELDITASDVLGLLQKEATLMGSDYLNSPYYLQK